MHAVLASSLECIKPRKLDELKLTAANILGSKPHRVLSNLQCVVHTLIVEHLDKATLFADFLIQMWMQGFAGHYIKEIQFHAELMSSFIHTL